MNDSNECFAVLASFRVSQSQLCRCISKALCERQCLRSAEVSSVRLFVRCKDKTSQICCRKREPIMTRSKYSRKTQKYVRIHCSILDSVLAQQPTERKAIFVTRDAFVKEAKSEKCCVVYSVLWIPFNVTPRCSLLARQPMSFPQITILWKNTS